MRLVLIVLLLWLHIAAAAQPGMARPTPQEFGYRHLVVMFGKDSVNVLIKARKGEEQVRKPLLLWIQGSLPQPLIMYNKRGPFRAFPFASQPGIDSLTAVCHLAIISKPGISLVANIEGQNPNQLYRQGPFWEYYCQRNYLGYYVRREEAVLRYLKKQPWVDPSQVLVGGHSQGSNVAAHLAAVPGLVSKAIYLSGSPLGRQLSEVTRDPADTDSTATQGVEAEFADWQRALDHPEQLDCNRGDSNKNISSFGQSSLPALLRIRTPIFIGYGTRDRGVVANDFLRLETMRLHKTNFTFRPYVGREHNFFGFKEGQVNYDDFYWDVVGKEFLRWAGLLQK